MVCSSCAAANSDDAAFCEACGASLGAASTTTPSASTPSASTPSASTPSASTPSSPAHDGREFLPGEAPSGRIGQASGSETPAGSIPTESIPTAAASHAPKPDPAYPDLANMPNVSNVDNLPCVACASPVEDEYCTVCGAKQPSARDHFEILFSPGMAGVCDKGIQHAANQDAMAIAPGPDPQTGVLVVCDGVTSAPLSERASLAAAAAACATLEAGFRTDASARTEAFWADALRTSCTVGQAETVAVARTLGDPPEPPSCTFVAAVVDAGVIHVGCCGDSRAYWLPDAGDGQILSVDDSIAAQLIATGTPRATAESDPRAHTITRWLGADSHDPTARVGSFKVSGDGWVAVVSDGMWNYASEPAALRAQMSNADALTNARAMVQFANAQGGVDNIAVTLLRLGNPPAETPPESNL